MDIITRSEWGARRRKGTAEKVSTTARTTFMAHHSTGDNAGTDHADCPEWVRRVQDEHMDGNGWQDIGYNFVICRHGSTYEGRGFDVLGAHCEGHNTDAIGACLLGDGDKAGNVTPEALAAFRQLYAAAQDHVGHRLTIEGHRDGFATHCPGDALYAIAKDRLGIAGGRNGSTTPARPVIVHNPVTRPQPAPLFPLPRGSYFGPEGGPRESVSGFHNVMNHGQRGHAGLMMWQRRMAARGWRITADGLYGDQTAAVAGAFQQEKGLEPDRLIGPATWAAAWTEHVTR